MVAPESNIGGQLSTIGALKHVLDSMQKNKDGMYWIVVYEKKV